jgi:hypothetical protein
MSLKDFVPIEKLGEGAFATVYKVRRMSDQQIYAMKKVIYYLFRSKLHHWILKQRIMLLMKLDCWPLLLPLTL